MPLFVGTRRILRPVPTTSAGAANYSNLTWRGSSTDSVDRSVYTFASLDFGTAAADRFVLAALSAQGGPAWLGGVTIGGVSATQLEGASSGRVSIWGANVTSGTTGSIVASAGLTKEVCHVGWWTVNMTSMTPHNTLLVDGEIDPSGAITIPDNGFAILLSQDESTSDQTHSIDSSFTERAEAFAEMNSAWSDREVTSAVTPTVTTTWGGSTYGYLVAVSFNGLGT